MKKLLALLTAACCALHSTIFIAGRDDLAQATLWITDSAGTLIKTTPLDTSTSEGANCIISGSEVYICGMSSSSKPSLWITDLFGIPKTPISLSDQEGDAVGIIASNNTIYAAGSINGGSNLWIIDKNTQQITSKMLSAGPFGGATALTLYENKLYIVGAVNGSEFNDLATLWVADLQGNIERTVYLSNIGSVPTGVSSDGQNIYILSHKSNDNNFYLTQTLLDGTVIKKISFATKKFDSCNLITQQGTNYLLTQYGLYAQTISKLDSTPYPLFIPKIDRNASWKYFQLKNPNIYIVGEDSLTRAALFIYTSGGTLKRITPLSSEGSTAFGLSILDPLDAFKKFSRVSFQRGL